MLDCHLRCFFQLLGAVVQHGQAQLHVVMQEELELYGAGLTDKPALLIANKADKVSEAATGAKHLEEVTGLPTVLVSGQTREGIEQLKLLLRQLSPTDVPA